MVRLTDKQRDRGASILANMAAITWATLIAGTFFSEKGFNPFAFVIGWFFFALCVAGSLALSR